MNIFSDDYVVFDYETGGFLDTPGGRPVEVGMLQYVGGVAKIHSHLVNPRADGDERFVISLDAEKIHGIGHDMLEDEGWHPEKSSSVLLRGLGDELPVWTHNGVKFDFKLMIEECRRFGLSPIPQARWRDTAALYKGWKVGKYPSDFANLVSFMDAALNVRRRGLYFSLTHLTAELDLGVKLFNEAGNPITNKDEHVAGWEVSPELGIPEDQLAKVESLGLHRAPFDCVVTHALVQWCKKELAELFEGVPDEA